jgi:pimeloyl-ACP methyl ester carboxylesterase
MATFVLIHGAGDAGWYWHLTEAELRARGHDTIAPDLPCDNEAASLDDYAAAVAEAAAGRQDLVLVAQSYGAFTATLAASQLPARLLVLLAGMIPAPGESPGEWWTNTGYQKAAEQQAKLDGGKTGHDDPLISYYNGVPRPLAEQARAGAGAGNPLWSGTRPGRWMRGQTCAPGSSSAGTTSSSPPPSCGGWPKSAWVPSPTRSPAAIAPRSATRRN